MIFKKGEEMFWIALIKLTETDIYGIIKVENSKLGKGNDILCSMAK